MSSVVIQEMDLIIFLDQSQRRQQLAAGCSLMTPIGWDEMTSQGSVNLL